MSAALGASNLSGFREINAFLRNRNAAKFSVRAPVVRNKIMKTLKILSVASSLLMLVKVERSLKHNFFAAQISNQT